MVGVTLKMAKKKKSKTSQRPRGVTVIAVWLLFSTIPGIIKSVQTGLSIILSPGATLDWAYILCAIICAIGLLLTKEGARQGTVGFFFFYCLGALLIVRQFSGSSFQNIVEMQSVTFMTPLKLTKGIIISLMVTHILWPIIVILYLTYPGVKNKFDPSHRDDDQ